MKYKLPRGLSETQILNSVGLCVVDLPDEAMLLVKSAVPSVILGGGHSQEGSFQ